MAIKCITLDLDRTTLNGQGKLSDTTKEALLAAMAQGIEIVVASGRSLNSLPQDILQIPKIRYAITSNGAAVYDISANECLKQYKMTEASVLAILEATKDEPVAYEVFIDGVAYGQKEYVDDPVAYGATPKAIPYIQATRIPVPDFTTFMRAHAAELDGLDVIVRSEEIKQHFWKLLQEQVPDIYITSSIQQLLEISYKDSGKHSGAAFMLEFLGLTREELAAFGDGDNDAEMLGFAKIGYAVENASPRCKENADRIVPAHTEDGVAVGIWEILREMQIDGTNMN